MQKLRNVLVIIFCFTLSVSCSNDDDGDTDSNSPSLLGTWAITMMNEGSEDTVELTFNANNSGSMIFRSTSNGQTETDSIIFTWTTSENILTLTMPGESGQSGQTISGNYSINGNKLTIDYEGNQSIVYTKK